MHRSRREAYLLFPISSKSIRKADFSMETETLGFLPNVPREIRFLQILETVVS